MEPLFVGDLVTSLASYKRIIEKYEKGLKKAIFMKSLLGKNNLSVFIQTGSSKIS
tara:strand:- start:163 stop:327 length:165 start_codon:yes stop_codon:yes gene_type:complete